MTRTPASILQSVQNEKKAPSLHLSAAAVPLARTSGHNRVSKPAAARKSKLTGKRLGWSERALVAVYAVVDDSDAGVPSEQCEASASDDDQDEAAEPFSSHTLSYGTSRAVHLAQRFKQYNLAQMWQDGRATAKRRPCDCRQERAYLRPGVIVSAAHHHNDSGNDLLMPNATIAHDDPYRTATAFGVVHSKFRKFVIVRTFTTGFLCLPVSTHNSTGMDHAPNQEEHLAIRDSRVRDPAVFARRSIWDSDSDTDVDESGDSAVIAHMSPQHDGKPRAVLSSKSYISLTEPVSFRYNTFLSLEGYLMVHDVARLQTAFQAFM